MRRLRIMAVLVAAGLVAGLVLPGVVAGAAQTGWQNFGKGDAVGRGRSGWPSVSIDSTTLQDPTAMRYVIRGQPSREVSVYWSLNCWNEEGYDNVRASGSYDADLPIVKKITEVTVRDWDYCSLDVSAHDYDGGTLTVKLQARYYTP